MKRASALIATLILTAAYLVISAAPVAAICHIVSFSKTNYNVNENEGKVTITINRSISEPGCTGTMEYSTSDDSAKAPSDYKATSCTDCKITNPTQGPYTFDVPIVDDTSAEGEEKFKVQFKHTADPPSSGVATGFATVTIQDNDVAPPPPPPPVTASSTPKKSPSPTPSPSAVASPSPSPSPSVSPGGAIEKSPEASPDAAIAASASPLVKTKGKSGSGKVAIIALIAILVAGGAGFGLWKLRRT